MPFKTKRAKIAAITRRYTFVETKTSIDLTQAVTKMETAKASPFSNQTHSQTEKIESDYGYVKTDLLRIILLTAVIIAAQITLVIFRQSLPNFVLP